MPQGDRTGVAEHASEAANLQPAERFAIEDLLTQFCLRVDHGRAATVAELFVEDGVIATPMFELRGREQIAAHFANRDAGGKVVSRHQWSNLRLESRPDGDVNAHMVVQTHLGTRQGTAPVQPDHTMVGDSLDVVRKDAAGQWRFVERRLVVAFRWAPGAAATVAAGGAASTPAAKVATATAVTPDSRPAHE